MQLVRNMGKVIWKQACTQAQEKKTSQQQAEKIQAAANVGKQVPDKSLMFRIWWRQAWGKHSSLQN